MPQIISLPKTIRDPETYAIIGACMEVHRRLGPGFLEPVYQEALAVEFQLRSIVADREVEFPIEYKGTRLASHYRVDFVCWGSVLVELKALHKLQAAEEAQVINYLLVSGLSRAVLLNFGNRQLEFKRFVKKWQGTG